MKKSDFRYDLPERLIAQMPLSERAASRLLVLHGTTGKRYDRMFADLPMLLDPGDLLVLNDTRVIPARLLGNKETGGKVEILIERLLDGAQALAHVRASKSPKPGSVIHLDQGPSCRVLAREEDLFLFEFDGDERLDVLLDRIGHVPLPPYIARADEVVDRDRYQTVYARRAGAVAAPTAGLHFDRATLEAVERKGVGTAFLTLHVGSGTFQPVRAEKLSDHKMHKESVEVGADLVERVRRVKARGGRIVAVGTTVVRALEAASRSGTLTAYSGETDLFIIPGYRFVTVDAMVTNFHLPESTLLMLVCAFAGYEEVMAAYRHAVEKEYRFFSYGDAMFLTR